MEVDGSSAVPVVAGAPSALERLAFAILRDGPRLPGGRFVGLETAPVEPWPHQAVVARRLVATWPYSYLLCDEVGLGKTIEAGLAFRSLYLSGFVKRILIAAPAGITGQWHRQMASKLLLSFGRAHTAPTVGHEYLLPAAERITAASLFAPDLVILSTGLLARDERSEGLKDAPGFDVALVDEAHAARRRNPTQGVRVNPEFGQLYTTIRDRLRPRARALWLATATPMQIDPVEVCDLLALTNRVGAFQFDPGLTLRYYDILAKLVGEENPHESEWDFLRRAANSLRSQDLLLWDFIEKQVIDGRLRTTVRRWLEYGETPRGRDRSSISRLIFGVSPLSRVMLRHTRGLLDVYRGRGELRQNLAHRHILPLESVTFSPTEQFAYDRLQAYCEGLSRLLSRDRSSRTRQMISFLLSLLRLRFASSLYALKETLRRRLAKVEATLRQETEPGGVWSGSSLEDYFDDEDEDDARVAVSLLKNRSGPDLEWERGCLREMLDGLTDLTHPSSKMEILLQKLDSRRDRRSRRIRQTVVFTRFYDTLADIVTRLRRADPGMLLGSYYGRGAELFDAAGDRMVAVDREEVKERFLRGEIDVLVCTDAAAEGLNLQTADLLVNFDLGWNPMKIEQRIGRIDRIGQKHADIYVLNLCYAGSAEEIVYGRLLTRLANAAGVVGRQQVSLLPVLPDEFEELAEGKLTPGQLEDRVRERIELQRRRTDSMEIPPGVLYDIYRRQNDLTRAPVNLEGIWRTLSASRYLRDLGCVSSADPGKPVLTLYGVEEVPEGSLLTVSRRLYEEGLGDGSTRVHFASYGEPFFDAVLDTFTRFGLPACIRRLAVALPGSADGEMAAYAALCRSSDGTRNVRLIKSLDDLKDLELAETEILTDCASESLRAQLERIAEEETVPLRAGRRIEKENGRAALAQEMLNFLVGRSLLVARARYGGKNPLFGSVLRQVESLFEDRHFIAVKDLPAAALRPVEGDLLFPVQVPAVGDNAGLSVPRLLAQTAMDAAVREADAMNVRKSQLTANTVIARLLRNANNRWREIVD